jgi:CBS domain containing-hemolysin-like protein
MLTFALLQVFLVVLIVAANAFFVAAEFALVSVRDTRIQQLVEAGRVGARTVQKLHSRLDELLAAVQFGVTLTSLGLGIVGEPTFARMLEAIFKGIPVPPIYIHTASVAIGFTLASFIHVVLGEIVPKSIALQRAERVALAVAGPIDVFMTLVRPALYVMSRTANWVLRAFGSRQMREGGVHSPEELKLIVTASTRVGLLPSMQEDIIHRALELGNLTVREIMVPRTSMFALPATMPLDEAMTRVVEEQHSRVPVYDPQLGPENIVGLLYSKDLSRFMHLKLTSPSAGASTLRLTVANVMRDVLVVPETKPVVHLLEEFKRRKRHLAIVVDEFGSTSGVVSVEDALEQIVGELEDEFDVAKQTSLFLASGTAVLDGSENIRDLETRHHLLLPRDEGFETLAGFLLARLGKIPKGGESVEFGGHRFTVLSMSDHRIAKVKVETVAARVNE